MVVYDGSFGEDYGGVDGGAGGGALNPNPALTLILFKGASLRSIIFCEGANTNFIRKRSERANPRSKGANSRSIYFFELTLDLRALTLGLRVLNLDLLLFAS